MSMQVETKKMTDKFVKELEKFMKWAEENEYRIRNKNGEDKAWNMELLTAFVEPARNKLETYIKELIKEFVIEKDNDEIEDAKLFAKEFKECKPKRKRQSQSETETTESETKEKTSNSKDKKEIKETKVKRVAKKSKKENTQEKNEIKDNKEGIIIDMNLDTTNTYYLDTLCFTTRELVNKLGEPKKTGGKNDKHRYEWRIMINENVYSIYDWCRYGKFEEFENEKWYIGGTSDDKKNVDKIIDYITGTMNDEIKKEKKTKKSPSKQAKANKVEEKTKKQKKTKQEKALVEENQELSELEQLEKDLGLEDDLDLETEIDENEDKKSLLDELDTTNLELFGEEDEENMLDLDNLDNMI